MMTTLPQPTIGIITLHAPRQQSMSTPPPPKQKLSRSTTPPRVLLTGLALTQPMVPPPPPLLPSQHPQFPCGTPSHVTFATPAPSPQIIYESPKTYTNPFTDKQCGPRVEPTLPTINNFAQKLARCAKNSFPPMPIQDDQDDGGWIIARNCDWQERHGSAQRPSFVVRPTPSSISTSYSVMQDHQVKGALYTWQMSVNKDACDALIPKFGASLFQAKFVDKHGECRPCVWARDMLESLHSTHNVTILQHKNVSSLESKIQTPWSAHSSFLEYTNKMDRANYKLGQLSPTEQFSDTKMVRLAVMSLRVAHKSGRYQLECELDSWDFEQDQSWTNFVEFFTPEFIAKDASTSSPLSLLTHQAHSTEVTSVQHDVTAQLSALCQDIVHEFATQFALLAQQNSNPPAPPPPTSRAFTPQTTGPLYTPPSKSDPHTIVGNEKHYKKRITFSFLGTKHTKDCQWCQKCNGQHGKWILQTGNNAQWTGTHTVQHDPWRGSCNWRCWKTTGGKHLKTKKSTIFIPKKTIIPKMLSTLPLSLCFHQSICPKRPVRLAQTVSVCSYYAPVLASTSGSQQPNSGPKIHYKACLICSLPSCLELSLPTFGPSTVCQLFACSGFP